MGILPSQRAGLVALTAIFLLNGPMVAKAAESREPTIVTPDAMEWIGMIPQMGNKGPAITTVFGTSGLIGQPYGGLVRVPPGGQSPTHEHSSDYWAVMISGTGSVRKEIDDSPNWIPPGSWWFQPSKTPHINKCKGPEECVFFVYYKNGMDYLILKPTGEAPKP